MEGEGTRLRRKNRLGSINTMSQRIAASQSVVDSLVKSQAWKRTYKVSRSQKSALL